MRTARIALLFVLSLFAFVANSVPLYAETWGKLYHGPWTDWSSGATFNHILKTADGGYLLVGTAYNRGVILKVDGAGTYQWSKLIKGGGYQRDSSMISSVETVNGDLLVTGQIYIDKTINPSASSDGAWNIYLIRIKSSGELVWERIYGRKNVNAAHPDTHEIPQYIYRQCPAGGGACNYVVTGYVIYSGVLGCIYNGYHSSQSLIVSENGDVVNDFIMGGPSATGDGAVKTVLTKDGTYLVLTELSYASSGLYTTGLQKYSAAGVQLWSNSYYEVFKKPDGDHRLKISAGAVVEVDDGYVLGGSTYYNYSGDTPLGAYYSFKIDKETGAKVNWNRKYRAWNGWDSLWILNMQPSPDGGLLTVVGDGVTTANDKVFRTTQLKGDLSWVNEYGAHLGAIASKSEEITLTSNAYDALFAKLTSGGLLNDSCKALPISDKISESPETVIYKTEVGGGYAPSGCNAGIGRATAYSIGFVEAGEFHQANRCAAYPELSVSRSGDFGNVNVGSSSDIDVQLSNYNGLSNLTLSDVALSGAGDCAVKTNSCRQTTIYPVNVGTPTSCAATIRFSPTSGGQKECTLSFNSNYDASISITLKGMGVGAQPTATPLPTATASPTPTVPIIVSSCFTVRGSVSSKGGGSVKVSPKPNCKGGKYKSGTLITFKAAPKKGYKFSKWSGAVSTKAALVQLTALANVKMTASFKKK